MARPPYELWADDAELLAQIGRALFLQPTRLTVRLPRELADRALATWVRDAYEGDLPPETPEQRLIRHRAGAVGLIGLSVEQRSRSEDDNNVVVELDAWQIGDALEAADDAGLLVDATPPPQSGATDPEMPSSSISDLAIRAGWRDVDVFR